MTEKTRFPKVVGSKTDSGNKFISILSTPLQALYGTEPIYLIEPPRNIFVNPTHDCRHFPMDFLHTVLPTLSMWMNKTNLLWM